MLHSVCDLKPVQMNVQYHLIWELMLYEFELGYNVVQAIKNICCVKGEGAVDHNTVTNWLRNFACCKNLDYQARSGRPKTADLKAMLQVIKTNLALSTQRLWGKLGISQSSVVHHLHNFGKSILNCQKFLSTHTVKCQNSPILSNSV